MGDIVKAIIPAAASFIPGVGPLIGAGLGAALGGGGNSGGSSQPAQPANPYASAVQQAISPIEAQKAAQQNANQAKNVMNQSAVQDTSATNSAITQLQSLLAGLSNPAMSTANKTPASLEQPGQFSWANPPTMASLVPSTQGANPALSYGGAAAPNSYMAAVGQQMGQPTAPTFPTSAAAPTPAYAQPAAAASAPGAPSNVRYTQPVARAPYGSPVAL